MHDVRRTKYRRQPEKSPSQRQDSGTEVAWHVIASRIAHIGYPFPGVRVLFSLLARRGSGTRRRVNIKRGSRMKIGRGERDEGKTGEMRKAQTNKGKILKRSEGKYKAVSQESSKRAACSSAVRNRLREEAFVSFPVYVPRLALRFTFAGGFSRLYLSPERQPPTIKDVPENARATRPRELLPISGNNSNTRNLETIRPRGN